MNQRLEREKEYKDLLLPAMRKRVYGFSNLRKTGAPSRIPVVVHLLEPLKKTIGGQEIERMMDYLNESYSPVGIQFVLARQTPKGEPFNGVVRVDASSVDNYAEKGLIKAEGSSNNHKKLKALSNWPHDKYYNIWIVSKIDGASGFAYFPGSGDFDLDGAVIAVDYIEESTVPHEIGHAFGLYHTFEGATKEKCPSGKGDRVDDTDPMKYIFLSHAKRNAINSCTKRPYGDLVVNYMSYVYSGNKRTKFTQGQIDRMNYFLQNSNRTRLLSSPALQAVSPPEAVVSASARLVMEDSPVQFNASVRNGADSFLWTFKGGSPATSTEKNPSVVFKNSGMVDVALQVSNNIGKANYTKNGFVEVLSRNDAKSPECKPSWSSRNSYVGIRYFELGDISFRSGSTLSDASSGAGNVNGYVDNSNKLIAQLTAGQTYPIHFETGSFNKETVQFYFDKNGNGVFESGEKIGEKHNVNGRGGIDFTVPEDAVRDRRLLFRAICNAEKFPINACLTKHGQAEDYGVYIKNVKKPMIVSQLPDPKKVCLGETCAIQVEAKNAVSYQWYFQGKKVVNSGDFQGGQTKRLVLPAVKESQLGAYHVEVFGEENQKFKTVAVEVGMRKSPIAKHPVSIELPEGAPGQFEVQLEKGPENYAFQWFRKGTGDSNFALVEGADSFQLQVKGVKSEAGAEYYVRVTSGSCQFRSKSASLNKAKALRLLSHPDGQTVCNGLTAAFNVKAENAVSYQWYWKGYKISDNDYYQGTNTKQLAMKSAHSEAQGNYFVELTGAGGQKIRSREASLKVVEAPKILLHPKSTRATEGETAVFNVEASKGSRLQWFSKKQSKSLLNPVEGATKNRLEVAALTANGQNTYLAKARNDGCSVFSKEASLEISPVLLGVAGSKVSIYPNPAEDYVYVIGVKKGRAELLDLSGKILFAQNLAEENKDSLRLNIGMLERAVYFLTVKSGKETVVFRLEMR
ncbi:MAG: PKD domain-containing protein [Cytophagales bacterium]|nr:PKD domain-containing protein [Cytophagales bacterium]